MFKLIYLPEALTVYLENYKIVPTTGIPGRYFSGRWKDRSELELLFQEYYIYMFHQKKHNRDIVLAKKELPKRKEALPKHLFEIMEFPDV